VGLHFEARAGRPSAMTVLKRGTRGKLWEVARDGAAVDRFSTLEQAVEAVDYEIDRMGRAASASARDVAPWRVRPAPPDLVARLRRGHAAATHADALRLLVWESVARAG
jgi:ATP-dependent helicase IRC3